MTPPAASEADGETRSGEKPKPPTRLVLVRHAVTPETGPKLTGRAPGVDLSADGVTQAKATALRLAEVPIAAIYASPIERATQTAELIASHHDLEVRAEPGVLEADYGDWTGGKIADLAKTDEWKTVQVAPSRAGFPNGETITAMQARVVAALDELVVAHAHETIVVVSHADPIKAAIAHYTGVHLDLFQRIAVSPASVACFEFHSFGVMLLKLNDTGSLEPLVETQDS